MIDYLSLIESELASLGLLNKAREIYSEFGSNSALSYVKSSYRLLSKVYHPDLNPGNEKKANVLQQRLNQISKLISSATDDEIIGLLKKEAPKHLPAKEKILVVEDEFGLQETLRVVFKMEGYSVRAAVDGDKGYEAFLQFKPDLVFTDVVMPGMTGIEMVRKIRETHPGIKVIYHSGFFGLRNLKRDVQEDASKYGYPCLAKPFKISDMLALVEEYLHNDLGVT